jgi:hypothetical protein
MFCAIKTNVIQGITIIMEVAAPGTAATPRTCIGIRALELNATSTSASPALFNSVIASHTILSLFTTVHIGQQTVRCSHCFSAHIHPATTRGAHRTLHRSAEHGRKCWPLPSKCPLAIFLHIHFSPYHCPQISRPSHLLQSSVRVQLGSLFYL